jgi:hypothetical protein
MNCSGRDVACPRRCQIEGEPARFGAERAADTAAATERKDFEKMCKILFDGFAERNMLLSR